MEGKSSEVICEARHRRCQYEQFSLMHFLYSSILVHIPLQHWKKAAKKRTRQKSTYALTVFQRVNVLTVADIIIADSRESTTQTSLELNKDTILVHPYWHS